MKLLRQKIKEARKEKGLTQEDLYELSKVNLRTIQRIENNENSPRGTTLYFISDALEIDLSKFNSNKSKHSNYLKVIVEILFLAIINFALIGVIGFLTLDSNANMNSSFGGFLISIFIPYYIVTQTKQMSNLERLFKFGTGFILYFLLVFFRHNFAIGFSTALFPCLAISLAMLYFGKILIKS